MKQKWPKVALRSLIFSLSSSVVPWQPLIAVSTGELDNLTQWRDEVGARKSLRVLTIPGAAGACSWPARTRFRARMIAARARLNQRNSRSTHARFRDGGVLMRIKGLGRESQRLSSAIQRAMLTRLINDADT